MKSIRSRWDLIVVAVTALVVRAIYIEHAEPELPSFGDAANYHLLGRHLAEGRGYIRSFDLVIDGVETPTFEFPPLWPMILGTSDLLGLDDMNQQRYLTAAIGAATAILAVLLVRTVLDELGPTRLSRPVGLLAGLLIACSPGVVTVDGSLHMDSIYAGLVTALLLSVIRARAHASPARWLLPGLLIAAAALTRSEALLYLVLVVPLAAHSADRKVWLRRVAIVLFPVVTLLAAWTIRNAATIGSPEILAGNGSTAVGHANCDTVYDGPAIGLWSFDCVANLPGGTVDEDGRLDEVERGRQFRHAAWDHVRHNLDDVPRVATVRVLRTFGLYEPTNQQNFEALEGRDRDWLSAAWVAGLVLLPFAVIGAVRVGRGDRFLLYLLLTPFLVAVLMSVLSYGNSRFRMAFEPTYHALAAIGLVMVATRLWRATGRERRRGSWSPH